MVRSLSRCRAHLVAPIAAFELTQEGSPREVIAWHVLNVGVVRVRVTGSMCSRNAHAAQKVVPGKWSVKC
jgi:hypothetical protein